MRKTLPERYYLDHFHEFLRFFDGESAGLLCESSRAFINAFRELDDNKQCIVARAANRKYALINRTHFNYEEIFQPQQQLTELEEDGWFAPAENVSVQDFAGVVTKNDLLAYLAAYPVSQRLNHLKKAELVTLLFAQINQYGWPQTLPQTDYLLKTFEPSLRYLLFLYFGNTKGRLNQFSMRDLGVMRTRSDATSTQARFATLEDAQAAFYFASALDEMPYWQGEKLVQMANDDWPETSSVASETYAEKYLFKLGSRLLPADRHLALKVLKLAPGDAAREKWIREIFKEDKTLAKSALEAVIDNPSSDSQLAFAEDFYARKFHKKRTGALTDMLRNSSKILQLDISQNQHVERGVIAWYKRHNVTAWRTENRLWRTLFGLTFWTQLFEQDQLVTEFDRRPQSLRYNRFYDTFSESIDRLLDSLKTPDALLQHVTKQAATHYGKVNSVFMWRANQLDTVKALLEHGPFESVKKLLKMMAQDYAGLSDGFPDIMVLENDQLRFEEIKAPGDVLRRNQLVSVQRLQRAGFTVHITQVDWFSDPQQPYVVVDIETTGGNNGYHRITEIGMVKMVGGEIVDSWQSLLQPQRHIPSSITRLTGISNEMVAEAPLFSDIADEVDTFTEDCVFVAHNVNFDYGFIKQEFARLERDFKRPKLCTVVQMRRTYPGLPSYSLASLTHHFGISMAQHHRAMSDARAAAELLNLIHERTFASQNK
ncbi:DNA polymerase III subunit epsilon [Salinimonas sp. HHU 13199]|uniref:DNA-directed DNA polymerase n=2 Tax=Salinimonas profundi TaxID=2729140 RepID=A0ABR8LK29_9ALTE|nr:DNA polymerase III subunit epsilon [Salinimonas profundi]